MTHTYRLVVTKRSAYEALYKGLVNTDEDGRWPHGWHGLDGDRCIKRDTLTVYEK